MKCRLRDNLSLGRFPIRTNLQATTCMEAAGCSVGKTQQIDNVTFALPLSHTADSLIYDHCNWMANKSRVRCAVNWRTIVRPATGGSSGACTRTDEHGSWALRAQLFAGRTWLRATAAFSIAPETVRSFAHSLNTICTQSPLFCLFSGFSRQLAAELPPRAQNLQPVKQLTAK